MIYLADTANCDEIKDLINYYPIVGVTTNPSLLALMSHPMTDRGVLDFEKDGSQYYDLKI